MASCYDTELTVMVQGSGTKWDLLTGSESVNAWTNCDAPRIQKKIIQSERADRTFLL